MCCKTGIIVGISSPIKSISHSISAYLFRMSCGRAAATEYGRYQVRYEMTNVSLHDSRETIGTSSFFTAFTICRMKQVPVEDRLG